MSEGKQDLYKTLGIERGASDREIRKAYHLLARKWHPDKHHGDAKKAAEEKFKSIQQAHEILGDEQKRDLYDQFGMEGVEAGGDPNASGSIFDLFTGGGRQRGPKRTDDIQFQLGVTLADFYNGKVKKLKVTRRVLCLDCSGKGSTRPGAVVKCVTCKGQGVRNIIRQVGPGMIQQMRAHCDACAGTGESIKPEDRCRTCSGKKTVNNAKKLEVNVDRGAKPGTKVNFFGEAHQAPDHETGDIVVILIDKEAKDQDSAVPEFKRTEDGMNLVMEKEITLSEALLGFQFSFQHLDGRVIKVKSPAKQVISQDDVIVVEGEGMPQHKNPTVFGDLYIKCSIKMPTHAEVKAQAAKIMACLPQPGPQDPIPPTAEEHQAIVFDAATQRAKAQERARSNPHSYDDEEDRGGPQCRQM